MSESQPLVNIALARTELLLIATLLQSKGIMGVEHTGTTNKEERALEIVRAELSLRARNVAMVAEDGTIRIARDLLNAVATCAYPQRSLVVYHTRSDGVAIQAFGHKRDKRCVMHTIINPELHNLQECANTEKLVQSTLDLAAYRDNEKSASFTMNVERDVLVTSRSLAEQQKNEQAKARLTQSGVDASAAETLVTMLSSTFSTTVFVTLEYTETQAIGREFTLLQSKGLAVLMTQANPQSNQYQLQGITRQEFAQVLTASMGGN